MRLFRVAGVLLLAAWAAAAAGPKEKIAMISFGDTLEKKSWIPNYQQNYHTRAKVEESFTRIKEQGFTTIYWRLLGEGAPENEVIRYSFRMMQEAAEMRKEFEGTAYAWDPYEIRWPIEVAHRLGLKFYAWIVPFNMGAPAGAYAELGKGPHPIEIAGATIYETQFPHYYKFVEQHPEYQAVDRKGKRYYYGVMEWAYPEARRYWTGIIQNLLDKYALDGIYMDSRVESMAPEYADQFGFNEPVVKEYQRRYGRDIRTEDFDLEQWRALRGEYYTQFLRESAAVIHAHGKKFSFGTQRGDCIGFPLGNMKLEWRKWISERIIDELHLDEHGWAWGLHGYGYVTDFATGRGLRPVEEMVRTDYGPLCSKYGVRLYFKPRLYPEKDEVWKSRVAAMPEFDGIEVRPVFR